MSINWWLRKTVTAVLPGIALLLWLATTIPPPVQPATNAQSPIPEAGFDPGVVLVRFRPLVPGLVADAAISASGFRTAGSLAGIGVTLVAVPTGTELGATAELARNPLVEYAEPDYLLFPLWGPNDTYYALDQWNLRKIGMETAWDITRGLPATRVAVIDTGLDATNPDRPKNIVSPRNECLGNSEISDTLGHGTHVSGIIAAGTDNGQGIAGMAPGVSLMPVKVDCDGSITVSRAAAGIHYAADNGASAINISLGATQPSQTLLGAVSYALGKGVLVVAAAGNEYMEGNPLLYPAAYSGVLAVGASTFNDSRASYSQVQPYVAVLAPGGDPTSYSDPDPNHWIKSTYNGPAYAGMAGTSMAAPHVSALAGLLWSASPTLSSAEVTGIITSTVVDLGPPGKDDSSGWGRIDAYAALRKARPAPSPAPNSTPIAAEITVKAYLPVLTAATAGW